MKCGCLDQGADESKQDHQMRQSKPKQAPWRMGNIEEHGIFIVTQEQDQESQHKAKQKQREKANTKRSRSNASSAGMKLGNNNMMSPSQLPYLHKRYKVQPISGKWKSMHARMRWNKCVRAMRCRRKGGGKSKCANTCLNKT